MRPLVVLLALGAGVAFAGCGTETSERDVSQVVERFQSALAASDGRAACAQLTVSTREALARDEMEPCRRAVLGLGLPEGGSVSRSDVYLTSGYAEAAGEALFLDQAPDGWRISAAGCTRTEDDLPYDCELEN
jgi:hypothetical protein